MSTKVKKSSNVKKKKEKKPDFLHRTYQFRVYLSIDQKKTFKESCILEAKMYNHLLKKQKEKFENIKNKKADDEDKERVLLNLFDCVYELNRLNKETHEYGLLITKNREFVAKVFSTIMTKYRKKQVRFPKPLWEFESLGMHTLVNTCIKGDGVMRFGNLKHIFFKQHRPIEGDICSAILKRESKNKYFISIVTRKIREIRENPNKNSIVVTQESHHKSLRSLKENHSLDKDLEKLFTLSEISLKKLNRCSEKTSNRYEKNKETLKRRRSEITNKIKDGNHKVSRRMVENAKSIEIKTTDIKFKKCKRRESKTHNRLNLINSYYHFKEMVQYKSQEIKIEVI